MIMDENQKCASEVFDTSKNRTDLVIKAGDALAVVLKGDPSAREILQSYRGCRVN